MSTWLKQKLNCPQLTIRKLGFGVVNCWKLAPSQGQAQLAGLVCSGDICQGDSLTYLHPHGHYI